MTDQNFNPASMISLSATTSTGSGNTLDIHPIYAGIGSLALAVLILAVVVAVKGRGRLKDLELAQEDLERQRAATEKILTSLKQR